MKFHNLGDEFLIDEIPKVVNSKQRVFITTLRAIKNQKKLPKQMPIFYTTKTLAAQIKFYYNYQQANLTDDNFLILEPNVPIQFTLKDKSTIRLLICEEDDISRNFMILIQKDKKVTHFYAGFCRNIRSALLNKTFAEWIRSGGVDKLYLCLVRAEEVYNPNETNELIDKIENIIEKPAKVFLSTPLIGAEVLIAKIAQSLRSRVFVTSTVWNGLYNNLIDNTHFQKTLLDAIIVVDRRKRSMEEIRHAYKYSNVVTIKIRDHSNKLNDDSLESNDADDCDNVANKAVAAALADHHYSSTDHFNYSGCLHEIQWSSLPTPFDLKLLTALVRPSGIYDITDTPLERTKLPDYLLQLCSTRKQSPIKVLNSKEQQTQQPRQKNEILELPSAEAPIRELCKSAIPYLDDVDETYIDNTEVANANNSLVMPLSRSPHKM